MNDPTLTTLLAEERFDEAKQYIESIFNSHEEKEGDLYVNLASTYLQVMNELNSQYITTMKDAVEALNAINSDEKELDKKGKLHEVRKKLNS